VTSPYLNTEFFSIVLDSAARDVKKNPLADNRIRHALSYGFYRKNLRRYLEGNIGVPGNDGVVPPGLPSYDSAGVVGYYYYPSKVKALLKEAGYENGAGLPEIVLHTNIEAKELCSSIQQQWEELGFKIKIEVHSHTDQMKMISEGELPFYRSSWIADYPDAENYLGLFYSKNIPPHGYNLNHFSNREYDDLYDKAMEEMNDSIRYVYYNYMDQMLMENAPVIVIYYDQNVSLTGLIISGIIKNSMNHISLKEVRKN
jgi:peptide/nickel transport system substrate-binding protein